MRYCVVCLQPDTRPNSAFTPGQVCTACSYYASLKDVDWEERRNALMGEIQRVQRQRPESLGAFDCIIGVSGGKDSTRQALWVRDNLGLTPLLICVAEPPRQLTDRGAANLSNLADLGFDILVLAPHAETWRQMMRHSFLEFANWGRSTELALFSGVPQVACEMDIPIILWGENPALQLGDLKALGTSGLDGNQVRNLNTLAGGSNGWLRDAGFSEYQLLPYAYPSPIEFEQSGIQIFYLGWALGDWSLLNNGVYSGLSGLHFRSEGPEATGDLFGVTSLNEDWVTLNQMIKYYKFGFGRATDYANELIRAEVISRDDGIRIVEEYDGACSDHHIREFCDYIDISLDQFWVTVKESCNKSLFDVSAHGRPKRAFKVGEDST